MTDIVQGLFGANPQELMAQRQAALQAQANNYAAQDPFARASSLLYQGGNQLAGAVGGMLGGQDQQMLTASKIAAIVKNGDQTTPEGMMAIAKQFAAEGLSGPAAMAQQHAQQMQLAQAKVATEQSQAAKYAADTSKTQYGMQQDMALRDALVKLGPDASENDVIKTVAQYGSPDKVLAVVQNAQDKRAARDQALEQARIAADAKIEAAQTAADARIEAAKQAGATKLEIAQLNASNKAMIAQMQVDSREQLAQLTAALKGPSAAQIKLDEKKQQQQEGQESLSDTISKARSVIKKLSSSGAIPSTSNSPISNLLSSAKNTDFGQSLGQTFGTKEQTNRDVLSSLQLQILNAVKTATGMSSTQLNSNMELQTWLNSLGNPKSTAEARLNILNNIEDTYIKKNTPMQKPSSGIPPEAKKAPDGHYYTQGADGKYIKWD